MWPVLIVFGLLAISLNGLLAPTPPGTPGSQPQGQVQLEVVALGKADPATAQALVQAQNAGNTAVMSAIAGSLEAKYPALASLVRASVNEILQHPVALPEAAILSQIQQIDDLLKPGRLQIPGKPDAVTEAGALKSANPSLYAMVLSAFGSKDPAAITAALAPLMGAYPLRYPRLAAVVSFARKDLPAGH